MIYCLFIFLQSSSEDELSDISQEEILDQESDESSPNLTKEKLSSESKVLILFLLLWQVIYKVSDNGISILLKFISQFLSAIGLLAGCEALVRFAKTLPGTLYMARIKLGLDKDDFEKFAACPKCNKLYKLEDCIIKKTNGSVISKRCVHVRYPNHPQKSRRTECGSFLMKKVRNKSGSLYLQPKRMYCLRPLKSSLETLLSKPGFIDKCEEWRNLQSEDGKMRDVHEGNIWKDFKDKEGKSYFSTIGHLAVMMNVDWFQPYKHTQHSCGVIYVVLMNLPRHERFKIENVIIVGIIPGPSEPKGNINSFLEPFVNELLDFWDGVKIRNLKIKGSMIKIRVALLALCCDIPAARKCGGFAGHNALKGTVLYVYFLH